jgi:hypothetical protein
MVDKPASGGCFPRIISNQKLRISYFRFPLANYPAGFKLWPIRKKKKSKTPAGGKPSSLIDTRVVYFGNNLDQLKKFPPECFDLIYIDSPFNSNRNYEVFWGWTKEKRSFEDRHASTHAYIEFMRPCCLQFKRCIISILVSFYVKSFTFLVLCDRV